MNKCYNCVFYTAMGREKSAPKCVLSGSQHFITNFNDTCKSYVVRNENLENITNIQESLNKIEKEKYIFVKDSRKRFYQLCKQHDFKIEAENDGLIVQSKCDQWYLEFKDKYIYLFHKNTLGDKNKFHLQLEMELYKIDHIVEYLSGHDKFVLNGRKKVK